MKKLNYADITLSEIDRQLEKQGICKKTIQNYRGKMLRFLQLMKSREENYPTPDSINQFFKKLTDAGASKSVKLHARFALRALFLMADDETSVNHLNSIFNPEDPLRPYQQKMVSALRQHGDERKYASYRKDLARFIQILPASVSEWDRECVGQAIELTTGRKRVLPKGFWYFFLFVLDRPDLVADLGIRFCPPLPQEDQLRWKKMVKEKTTSQVLARVYHRSAGLAYTWSIKKKTFTGWNQAEVDKMNEFVLSQTGPSFHPLVLKSLDSYLEHFLRRGSAE